MQNFAMSVTPDSSVINVEIYTGLKIMIIERKENRDVTQTQENNTFNRDVSCLYIVT